ncbi:MAG: hypothetical protein ACYC3B_06030 [Sedimentisphaerales bacterium]
MDTFCGRFRPDLPITGSGAVAVSSSAGGGNLLNRKNAHIRRGYWWDEQGHRGIRGGYFIMVFLSAIAFTALAICCWQSAILPSRLVIIIRQVKAVPTIASHRPAIKTGNRNWIPLFTGQAFILNLSKQVPKIVFLVRCF